VSDVTITYIETGQTNPARRTLILLAQVLENDFGDPDLRQYAQKRQRDIPIVGRVAAGKPIERVEDDKTLTIGPEIVKRADDMLAFEVEGESMTGDHIIDSDVLLCREVLPGRDAIAVVEFDDDTATVKRWKPKGKSVTLGSESYSIKRIRRTFEVVGLIRKMRRLATFAAGAHSASGLEEEILRLFRTMPAERQRNLIEVAKEFIDEVDTREQAVGRKRDAG
jgi:SOS-response transcriptional repressor LexA